MQAGCAAAFLTCQPHDLPTVCQDDKKTGLSDGFACAIDEE
jgi:hypothetical protein